MGYNTVWYTGRLAWYAFPWSLAGLAAFAAWTARERDVGAKEAAGSAEEVPHRPDERRGRHGCAACCSPWPRPSCSIVLLLVLRPEGRPVHLPGVLLHGRRGRRRRDPLLTAAVADRRSPGPAVGASRMLDRPCFCCASPPARTCRSSRSGGRDRRRWRWALGAGRWALHRVDDRKAVGAGRSAMDGRLAVAPNVEPALQSRLRRHPLCVHVPAEERCDRCLLRGNALPHAIDLPRRPWA